MPDCGLAAAVRVQRPPSAVQNAMPDVMVVVVPWMSFCCGVFAWWVGSWVGDVWGLYSLVIVVVGAAS